MQRCALGIQNYARRLAGHSELGAAALTKAIWQDLRLASLLTHLFFVCLYGYGFLSGGKKIGA